MNLCRHRHRDDRHCVAVPIYRELPGASFMSHGVGVLNMTKIVCPRLLLYSGDRRKSRIGNLRPSAGCFFS